MNQSRTESPAPPADETARVVAVRRSRNATTLSWLGPIAASLALAVQLATMLTMTWFRYTSQGLEPDYFNITLTANLVGLLFIAPFISLDVALILDRRRRRRLVAAGDLLLAGGALALLWFAPELTREIDLVPYAGWGLFLGLKLAELTFLLTSTSRRRPKPLRQLVTMLYSSLLTVLLVLVGVIGLVLMSPIGSTVIEQPAPTYDAGVILGAAVWSGNRPSPVLRERIRTGYDLLRNGTVQFLVLTGGNAPNELAEAEVARRELVKLGADPTRIVVETNTSSTLDQILYIRDQIARKQGWDSFVIVSDQFHLKRALEIADFNGLNARGVSSESPLGPQNLVMYHLRESLALILYWLFGM